MTDEEKLEKARELLRHLVIRKRLIPLDFFEPLTLQDKFSKWPGKIKGVFGGNRAGKSQIGAAYIIQKCLAKPKQRWWAVAETYDVSVSIQQRKIWELLPKMEMRYCYYDEVNGFRNNKIIFKNGSMIRFKSYEQGRESFASDDIDGIWNDEEPPFDVYKEQKMRLIDRDGEMIFTMTSLKGITELMQELFEDHDIIESQYAPLLDEVVPRVVEKNGVRFFMLWSTENPHITQSRLADDLKMMTKQEIKCRIYGIPINLSGRIYPMFNKRIHVVSTDLIPKTHMCIWHVLDPHDRKPWAMQWWAVHKLTGRRYCIREYPWRKNFNEMEYDDKTYRDYVAVIREIEYGIIEEYGRSVSRRIIDPNFGNATERKAEREGGQSKTTPKQELKRLGLHFIDGIDALEAGHLAVRKGLHFEEKEGELIVKPTNYISEECENSIRHISRYSRKDITSTDGDVKDNVKPMDKYKDFADCHRYFDMANPHYIDRFAPEQIISDKKPY